MTATPNPTPPADAETIRQRVTDRYGAVARQVLATGSGGCCGAGSATSITTTAAGPFDGIYSPDEAAEVPGGAAAASLGCGNPTALAELAPGEVVLDLGSGGGIDVILSARRVGPTGKAYGLDMTDEMLELARRNQAEAGVDNVEFLRGQIEDVPLPDQSVDVVISNCVINLSANKSRVLTEAFRVLRPGGRFAVSDLVVRGELSAEVRRNLELWASCVAGALTEDEYRAGLEAAGFVDVDIETTRVFGPEDVPDLVSCSGIDASSFDPSTGTIVSAFVRARRPAGSAAGSGR